MSARTTNHHWQLYYLNVNTIHMLVGKGMTRLKAELGHMEWIIALYKAYELRNRYLKRAVRNTCTGTAMLCVPIDSKYHYRTRSHRTIC